MSLTSNVVSYLLEIISSKILNEMVGTIPK